MPAGWRRCRQGRSRGSRSAGCGRAASPSGGSDPGSAPPAGPAEPAWGAAGPAARATPLPAHATGRCRWRPDHGLRVVPAVAAGSRLVARSQEVAPQTAPARWRVRQPRREAGDEAAGTRPPGGAAAGHHGRDDPRAVARPAAVWRVQPQGPRRGRRGPDLGRKGRTAKKPATKPPTCAHQATPLPTGATTAETICRPNQIPSTQMART